MTSQTQYVKTIAYIKNGNIFRDRFTRTLVNPVNCVGVMGAGLALQFKKRFDYYFVDYVKKCRENKMQLGKVDMCKIRQIKPIIISFPTKNHWRDKSTMKSIEYGLLSLKDTIIEHDIEAISIPALGCGLGGLHFKDVKQAIEDLLMPTIHRTLFVNVYEPWEKNNA